MSSQQVADAAQGESPALLAFALDLAYFSPIMKLLLTQLLLLLPGVYFYFSRRC